VGTLKEDLILQVITQTKEDGGSRRQRPSSLGLQEHGLPRELWRAYQVGGHQGSYKFQVACFLGTLMVCKSLNVLGL
jgi:hypothetical protein